jgi:hypothetical protein
MAQGWPPGAPVDPAGSPASRRTARTALPLTADASTSRRSAHSGGSSTTLHRHSWCPHHSAAGRDIPACAVLTCVISASTCGTSRRRRTLAISVDGETSPRRRDAARLHQVSRAGSHGHGRPHDRQSQDGRSAVCSRENSNAINKPPSTEAVVTMLTLPSVGRAPQRHAGARPSKHPPPRRSHRHAAVGSHRQVALV